MGFRRWVIIVSLAAASLAGCASLEYHRPSQYPLALIANDPSLANYPLLKRGCRSARAHSVGVVALLNATKNRPYGVSHTVVKIENSVSLYPGAPVWLALPAFSGSQVPIVTCHATLVFTHGRTESGVYTVYPPIPQQTPPRPLRAYWISDNLPKTDYQRGEAYYKGEGVPQSDTKAADWWDKAAELRDGYWSQKAAAAFRVTVHTEAIKAFKDSCGNPKVIAFAHSEIPVILGLHRRDIYIRHIFPLINRSWTMIGSVIGHKGLSGVIAMTCPIRVIWSNGLVEDKYISLWKNRYGQEMAAYGRRLPAAKLGHLSRSSAICEAGEGKAGCTQ